MHLSGAYFVDQPNKAPSRRRETAFNAAPTRIRELSIGYGIIADPPVGGPKGPMSEAVSQRRRSAFEFGDDAVSRSRLALLLRAIALRSERRCHSYDDVSYDDAS